VSDLIDLTFIPRLRSWSCRGPGQLIACRSTGFLMTNCQYLAAQAGRGRIMQVHHRNTGSARAFRGVMAAEYQCGFLERGQCERRNVF
jgi:hypothetical protein